jgi:DNA-binding transcriptional LysR family regulator
MIDLDLLRAFLAIFRHGSITKAADSLALSQSAMSGRLQALEAKLGKTLFVREGRAIRVTQDAMALARAVAPHVDSLETVFDAFRRHSDAIAGPIRIAAPDVFIECFVVPALGVLIELGVRPEFVLCPVEERLDSLAAGDLDLAILTTGGRKPVISTAPLHRERFVLVAAPRWEEALRANPQAAFANGELPILAYAHSLPIIRRYWSEVFGCDPTFRAGLVLPDLRALIVAAVAGIGATVVPDYLCQTQLEAGQLVQHHPLPPVPTNVIELAWRRGSRQNPRTLMMRDLLLRIIQG